MKSFFLHVNFEVFKCKKYFKKSNMKISHISEGIETFILPKVYNTFLK